MYTLNNVFDAFLPQLLVYPNVGDPLNGEDDDEGRATAHAPRSPRLAPPPPVARRRRPSAVLCRPQRRAGRRARRLAPAPWPTTIHVVNRCGRIDEIGRIKAARIE